jgi:hypothetical protein
MVSEEDEVVACGERLGDGNISRPCRSAVFLQEHVVNIMLRQRISTRAGVIYDVDAREHLSLSTNAFE